MVIKYGGRWSSDFIDHVVAKFNKALEGTYLTCFLPILLLLAENNQLDAKRHDKPELLGPGASISAFEAPFGIAAPIPRPALTTCTRLGTYLGESYLHRRAPRRSKPSTLFLASTPKPPPPPPPKMPPPPPPPRQTHTHTLALITIGQSPRHDYAPDLPRLLPRNTRLVQHGALDALSLADVRATLSPPPPEAPSNDDDDDDGDDSDDDEPTQILVSRMRDGTEVKMDAGRLKPLVEACVRGVAAGASAAARARARARAKTDDDGDDDDENDASVDAILLLCTGDVPRFDDDDGGRGLGVPVIAPQEAVRRFLEERGGRGRRGRRGGGSLRDVDADDAGTGRESDSESNNSNNSNRTRTTAKIRQPPRLILVSPEERQVAAARRRWDGVGGCEVVGGKAATPYGEASEGEVREVAGWVKELVGGGGGEVLVYMDCMGYTLGHKRIVEEVVGAGAGAGVEVVVPREVVFRAVGALFGEEM
ncbi:uncharacterized protein BKCO1_420005 [Diplodia corticola]|uniref:Uncharacterized protein n=1 Tax=Diplodia corticola TaxID=236234 RepID=A0A1J9RVY7_9PEZI|nr:uncharacterized protein BKCO1_420005 [Diplodia corticola]OJD32004.1 hypothetical protein BKCO1_420005 [Diplodia corticola]